jgi:hypothetical protein
LESLKNLYGISLKVIVAPIGRISLNLVLGLEVIAPNVEHRNNVQFILMKERTKKVMVSDFPNQYYV